MDSLCHQPHNVLALCRYGRVAPPLMQQLVQVCGGVLGSPRYTAHLNTPHTLSFRTPYHTKQHITLISAAFVLEWCVAEQSLVRHSP